jgi:hypothetical protein
MLLWSSVAAVNGACIAILLSRIAQLLAGISEWLDHRSPRE